MRKIIPLSIAAICLASSGMALAQTPPACKTFNTPLSGNISAVTTISENMGVKVNVAIMCTSTKKALYSQSIQPVSSQTLTVGKLNCGKTSISDGVINFTPGPLGLGGGKLSFSGKVIAPSKETLSSYPIANWRYSVCQ